MASTVPPPSGLLDSILAEINDIPVNVDKQITTLEGMEELTTNYTRDLKPATYLIGNKDEERDLYRTRPTRRQIEGVAFATKATFGFPEDVEISEDYQDKAGTTEDDIEDDQEDTIPMYHEADTKVTANGEIYHVAEYLGQDWVRMIRERHAVKPLRIPPGITVIPHDHQLKGAAEIHHSISGPFRFIIVADPMGMGKTLQMVLTMLETKDQPGMYLVVAPASVCLQWVREIHQYFEDDHGLRAYWLHDPHKSATWLLSQGFDVVVVTYEFLEASSRAIGKFKEQIEKYANKNWHSDKPPPPPKRPTSALFSPLYEAINQPFKITVLDEAHNASKRMGKRHRAIKLIPTESIAALSGTAAHNRWDAFSGYLDFAKRLPWKSHGDFMKTFCGVNADENSPGFVETRVLQRLLQNLVLARPLGTIAHKLPGLKQFSVKFELDAFDAGLVQTFTDNYKDEHLKARLAGVDYSGHRVSNRDNKNSVALAWAAKARAAAAHPLLLERVPKKVKKEKTGEDSGVVQNDDVELVERKLVSPEAMDPDARRVFLETIHNDRFLLEHAARYRALLKTYNFIRHVLPDSKIIITSMLLGVLDIADVVLEKYCDVKALRFDGTVPVSRRDRIIKELEEGPAGTTILVTAGAGSVGLNLQCVSVVIQMEPWWNISNEEQQICRAFRIKQEKIVTYMRLEATNSAIDNETIAVQLKKKLVIDRIMQPLIHRHDEEPEILDLFI
ncbi:hypothetical protein LTR67_005297 [Exophiala xenobiotica]